MRGKRKFGLILLLAVFVVPAFGQGQPADKTITVFGQSIHYFDIGSGPVVVLLHGLGSRKEDWLPVLEQDTPIPDLNPSSLAAMRGVMEAVFYDTSWVNDEALRKIFTDKLAVK